MDSQIRRAVARTRRVQELFALDFAVARSRDFAHILVCFILLIIRESQDVHRVSDELHGRRLLAHEDDAKHDDCDVANLTGGFKRQRPARLDHPQSGHHYEKP